MTNEFGRSVSVIEHGRVAGRIGGFLQPGGITAVGREVAFVDGGGNRLTLIDAYTLKRRIGTASAGAGPTHAVAGLRMRPCAQPLERPAPASAEICR